MAVDIRFLGHAAFELSDGDADVLDRPVPDRQPEGRRRRADEVEPTHILLTHGHADHIGDTVAIAKRTGATGAWRSSSSPARSASEGVENVLDPNFGGTVKFDWGWVKLVPAWHTVDDAERARSHTPAGLLDQLSAASSSTTSATPRCSATCS